MESLENAPFKRLMEKHRKLSFTSSDSDSNYEEPIHTHPLPQKDQYQSDKELSEDEYADKLGR